MRRSLVVAVLLALAASLIVGSAVSAKVKKGKKGKAKLKSGPVLPEWGGLDSPIRPGSSLGGYCTLNWVFYENVEPTPEEPNPIPKIYIGTAGHCTDDLGEEVQTDDLQFGEVVYDSDLLQIDVDFSLIEITPDLVGQTNPQMRGWDGPTGVVKAEDLELGDRVDVYGYGIGVGEFEETRPRYGFLMEATDKQYAANMPAVNGDSGSPLLHHETGLALGIISQYGIRVPPSTDFGPLVPWILDELETAGFDITLATI